MENKKRLITDLAGNNCMIDCLGCAMQRGELESQGGNIIKTDYFDAHQDFEIPIPGFIILASRRHLLSIDEFTEQEQLDFIKVMTRIRLGMRKILGIDVVYFIQEEDTSHHFHVWLFPRYEWMEQKFGRKIQSVRPIMEYAKEKLKIEENITDVIKKASLLREYLKNL